MINFSQNKIKKTKKRHNRDNTFFIIIFFSLMVISIGYLGKDLLASIVDTINKKGSNSYEQLTIQYIEPKDLLKKMNTDKKLTIIDVRSSSDYEWEHIDGFINIPLNELESNYNKLNKSNEIVTFCANSECEYSKIAARRLKSDGFDHVKVLSNTIEEINLQGFKVVKSDNNELIQGVFKVQALSQSDYDNKNSQNKLVTIDIRDKSTYDKKHLPDAMWLDKTNLPNYFDKLPKNKSVVIISDSQSDTIKYGSQLFDAGYLSVFYIK
jgi:rhodanese-related sulfurtransferase